MGMRALALALLLTACGEPKPSEPAMPECPAVYEDPGPGAALGLVTENADILPQAQCAAARWSNATGIDIRVGESTDGRNITFKWLPVSRSEYYGKFVPALQEIRLEVDIVGQYEFPAVVAHEVGHAIANRPPWHIAADAVGLMNGGELEDPPITMADLKLVCGQAKCERERAESQ